MKMAGPVLRWLCSSYLSPGLIRNRNLFCRAFSAATPTPEEHTLLSKINLESKQSKSDGVGLLGEAQGSENWESFKSWMSEHNKSYESEEEMLYRFEIFNDTLKSTEKWNKESSGCTFGLNDFSDLAPDEFPKGRCPRPGGPHYAWD